MAMLRRRSRQAPVRRLSSRPTVTRRDARRGGRLYHRCEERRGQDMSSWKGAFVAVLLSGVVFGILNGHLAVWTAVGAALGAVLAGRERNRTMECCDDRASDSTSREGQSAQIQGMV